MNRAAKFTLGCLFAPIGLALVAALFFGALHAVGVPDPKMGGDRLEQEISREARTAMERRVEESSDSDSAMEIPAGVDPVLVILDMEEGRFDIRGDDTIENIVVDAEYDEATYELVQEYDIEDGRPVYRLRFKSTVSLLRRIAQDGGIDDSEFENEIDIRLPVGTPMELRLNLSKSESDIELSGLAITNLVTRLRMGEYHLETSEANPLAMNTWTADVGMGEVSVRGASLLGARNIQLKGGMGEISVDFGERLRTDTKLSLQMRMGEMRLRLPDDVLWDPDSRFKATMGEVTNSTGRGHVNDPELARRLRVDARVLMGELVVDEFRVRTLRNREDG